jgi:hypothetical protein
MDSRNIEALLEKYWNCETSLEEEQQLRDYFRLNPEHDASEVGAMFRYFDQQRSGQLPNPEFNKAILGKMNEGGRGKSVRMVYNFARIAAGLLVVVAATFLVRKEMRKSYPAEDTFSDPKMAFEETKKALMMISKGFGKGQKEVNKINVFNDAENKVEGKQEKKADTPI